MKTNEIITGLRKLCGQGTEYRRTVCRLAADALETQQKRIAELEKELGSAVHDLGVASKCWSCKRNSKCHPDMPVKGPDVMCGNYKWRGGFDGKEGTR